MLPFSKTVIGKPAQWLIEAAASIGLDFSGFRHETTDDLKRHVMKRHGDPDFHGAATITDKDFTLIPGIVKTPDTAIIGATRKGRRYVVYAKIEPGMTWVYFEQILNSRKNKVLRGSTFYKVTKPLALDSILKTITMNNKTDITGAAIVSPGRV